MGPWRSLGRFGAPEVVTAGRSSAASYRWSVNGGDLRDVAGSVLADVDRLVERMGAAYRAEVTEYADMTDAEFTGAVLPVSRLIVVAFFDAVQGGGEPAVVADHLRQMGRQRLEMGIGLEPMLHVYRVATRTVWDRVVEVTPPGGEQVLAEIGARWMEYMDRSSSHAASGYLEASHDRLRRIDAHRSAFLDALLGAADAADAAAVADRFATNLAPAYRPLLLARTGGDQTLERTLDLAPPGAIGGFRGPHVCVLVPAGPADAAFAASLAGLRLVTDDDPSATLVHGPPARPGPELAAAVAAALRLLGVAAASGRAGVVGPDDLLEAQLVAATPRVARALVDAVVAPLRASDRDGVLEATLRTYLSTGSVPGTAALVFVHANTVAYRLRRIDEITDLDPRRPAASARLLLALLAADLAAASGPVAGTSLVDSPKNPP